MLTVLVNESVGRAAELRESLERTPGIEVRAVAPEAVQPAVRRLVAEGATRVAIVGGDGTVAAAAACLAGTDVELAVIPGGTLNHFAADHGVPLEPARAAEVARSGERIACVDVGRVNDRLMLNTSAVGAYSIFVRERERYERRFSYRIASLLAAFHTLLHLRPVRVELEVDGRARTYHTPLLFVGVGEREVRIPMLGSRVPGGRRGLHVLVARDRTAWGFLFMAFLGAMRGVREISRTRHLDAFLVERCRVHVHRRSVLAIDGELVTLSSPLDYRLVRDALRVVVPADDG